MLGLGLVAGVVWWQYESVTAATVSAQDVDRRSDDAYESVGATSATAPPADVEREEVRADEVRAGSGGPQASADPADPTARRVFAGIVITEAGDPVPDCVLEVRPRGSIPGEDDEAIPVVKGGTDREGGFSIELPGTWRGSTLHCRASHLNRTLGMGVYSVARDHTIVVAVPSRPPSFEYRVSFEGCGVGRAALLLTNPARDIGFGEAVWEPLNEHARVTLAIPQERVTGPVLVMLGELGEGSRISFLARHEYPSLASCIDAGSTGIRVACAAARVEVPPFQGVSVRRAKIWPIDGLAVAASWLAVENDAVSCRLATERVARWLHCANGELEDGRTVVGRVSDEAPWRVLWQAAVDPELRQRIAVTTPEGEPLTDAVASVVLQAQVPGARGGVFVRHGRADTGGWIDFVGLCPGTYRGSIERMVFGDSRRQIVQFDVPGPDVRCVIPVSGVVRLEPDFGANAIQASGSGVWLRAAGGAWREVTDPRWQFTTFGLIEGLAVADYDFLCRQPPYVGIASVRVSATSEVQDIPVRMAWETVASGQVVDEKGRPVEGRWVSAVAMPAGGRPGGPDWSQQRTGPDGRFEICLIPNGNVRLHVWTANATGVATTVDAGVNVSVVVSDN